MKIFFARSVPFLILILAAQLCASPSWAQNYYRRHHYHHHWYNNDSTYDDTAQSQPDNSSNQSQSAPAAGNSDSSIISGPPVPGMVLTFDEEFNRLSASSSGQGTIWQTKFWYNSLTHSNWANLDLSPDVCGLGFTPYSINNGVLRIHAQWTDSRLKACGVQHPFTSGNLYSYQSFSQQYGYFEIRAQASGVYGTTFAFWMIPKDNSWPPEIDITESLGKEPMIDHVSNHTSPSNRLITFPVNTGVDLSAGFHTYGLLWDPSGLTYMLDGVPVGRTSTEYDEHKPFYMIIGLGAGSCDSWMGCPTDPNFNADVYVDFVRVWQFPDQSPARCVGDC